jgi:glycerol-3-phosphate O-acyltransferase
MATWEGVCQAVFPEGGLTRDGRLQKPKLGILDYMLRGFDPERGRDIVFVPVGINYDRVLEDRSLVRRLDPQARRRSKWFVLRTTAGFAGRNLWLMARNRWQRFGYAGVSFGAPLSARAWCRERGVNPAALERATRASQVERLAAELMARVTRLIPVLPIPLVAEAVLAAPEGLGEFDLKARVCRRIERLQAAGAVVIVPPRSHARAVDTAFRMLKLRRLVEEEGGRWRPVARERGLLAYYAHSLSAWPAVAAE